MTKEELKKLKGAYRFQKSYSKKRVDRNGDPIGWEFTFEEWLDVWQSSGKLHLRGTFAGGYVMARNDDIGPYSRDNVKIITHSENCKFARSYWEGPSEEVRARISNTLKGREISEDLRQKYSEAQKKRWENTDRSTLNWHPSPETLEKMSKARLGKKLERVECPHCGKVGGKALMTRYHFDNCKNKQ